MKKYLVLIFLLLIVQLAFAAEYYCDLSLSGDGNGTTGNPWQWSQAVNSANVSAGDTVYLRGTSGSGKSITTDSHANGSSGNQIVYAQWSGQTQAQFPYLILDGTPSPYYEFNGLRFDAGEGTTWVTAISELLDGTGGELTFNSCTIYGFRSTLFSGGDFYPYYVPSGDITSGAYYAFSLTNLSGVTLKIQNCTFMHGRRIINLLDVADGSTLIDNNTFDRCGEDFISIGGSIGGLSDNIIVSNNTFGKTYQATREYDCRYWGGTATGIWSGHEGETVTQDNTSSSGIYVGTFSGLFYIVADDEDHIPSRADDDPLQIWRLDSDPTNIYWTPNNSADSSHNDHIQLIGNVDDITIEGNFFQGVSPPARGYGLKFDGRDSDPEDTINNAAVQNNIFYFNATGGVYCILMEYSTSSIIANNIIINNGYTTGAMRYLGGGTYYVANNIITGASDLILTGVTATNNIFDNSDPWSGSNSLTNQDFTDAPSGNNRYFINFADGNFTTYDSDSPQVDAGSVTYAPDDDYLGTARPKGTCDDIGAYEYISGEDTTPPAAPGGLTVE